MDTSNHTNETDKYHSLFKQLYEVVEEMDEALNDCDNSASIELYKNGYEALRYLILKSAHNK